jgi:alanine-glyoxylate transaminase/serine-glyoxylate transaminase/serine-pyruvate transaminase
MGPGPSDVSPRVLAALSRPTVGHLDPAFQDLMEEIKAALARLFNAPDHACVPLPAPGTAGMEAALMNLLEPGDRAVIAVNGVFGGRMVDMAGRAGAEVVRVDAPWGEPVDVAAVEAALASGPAKVLAFVHAETSTGVRSDAAALCALARRHGALSIVDCVTSLGGVPVDAAAWDADVLYSGTQKCLSAPPGLSPVAFSRRALEAVAARTTPVRNWLLDVSLLMAYWGGEGGRTYHHTAPINLYYGLREALALVAEEGLEARWQRHQSNARLLWEGLAELGLSSHVAEEFRLPTLTTVRGPDGVDAKAIAIRLLKEYNLEVGLGLGELAGKVWRVGLMGHNSRPENVLLFLAALKHVLG